MARLSSTVNQKLRVKLSLPNLDKRISLGQSFPKLSEDNTLEADIMPGKTSLSIRLTVTSAEGWDNFGVSLDNLDQLPEPIRFDGTLEWSLGTGRCPRLGCPMIDPRSKTLTPFMFEIPLQSGKMQLLKNYFLSPRHIVLTK